MFWLLTNGPDHLLPIKIIFFRENVFYLDFTKKLTGPIIFWYFWTSNHNIILFTTLPLCFLLNITMYLFIYIRKLKYIYTTMNTSNYIFFSTLSGAIHRMWSFYAETRKKLYVIKTSFWHYSPCKSAVINLGILL